jgi:hypothetical protein
MKIRLVAAELFHDGGREERHDEANSRFSQICRRVKEQDSFEQHDENILSKLVETNEGQGHQVFPITIHLLCRQTPVCHQHSTVYGP